MRTRQQRDTDVCIARARCSVGIETDNVPLDDGTCCTGPGDVNALVAIIGDYITVVDAGAADDGIGTLDVDARVAVAYAGRTGSGGADPVVRDGDAISAGIDLDTITREVRDHEPAHDTVVAAVSEIQSVAGTAVDTDHRVAGIVRFGRSIDDHRVGDGRQGNAGQVDHVRAGPGDVEGDGVGHAGIRIRIQYRLVQ